MNNNNNNNNNNRNIWDSDSDTSSDENNYLESKDVNTLNERELKKLIDRSTTAISYTYQSNDKNFTTEDLNF
jgi:selenocysteine lyase/cysteine desulfurase